MQMTSLQYLKLHKLFRDLKSNNEFYINKLNTYSDITDITQFYNELQILKKQTIIDSLDYYYDKSLIEVYNHSKIDLLDIILRTDDLSENHDKVLHVGDSTWSLETTSGTTGNPLPIIKNKKEKLIESKYLAQCRKRFSYDSSISNGMLFVHKIDEYIKNIDLRENKDSNFNLLYDYMIKRKPKWIFSTTLILKNYVDFIARKGYDTSLINLDFIETTSQKLFEDDKERIKLLFNCRFANNYGCREVWNIAYSCKFGNLHVDNVNLMVDVVDDDGKIIDDENVDGNIIITSLVNRTTPFIKYLIGDRGKILSKKCECGYDSPILILCEGRNREKLVGTNYYGNVVFRKVLRTINFHNEIKDIHKIRIVQSDTNTLKIYVKKEILHDIYFEKCFKDNFEMQIKKQIEFNLIFIYDYPFKDIESKEILFINEIKDENKHE